MPRFSRRQSPSPAGAAEPAHHSRISRRRVAFLAVPPVYEIDVVGPWEVFASANQVLGPRRAGYALELIGTGTEAMVAGQSGLLLGPQRWYGEVSDAIDTLIVAGGSGAERMRDAALLEWLRDASVHVRRIGSICSGAFLLAEAGLLNGRRATTHWSVVSALAARYPRVRVDPDPIWVQDGNIYTSAGMTVGMDLAMSMVEEDWGSAVALEVSRLLVLFVRRPGSQAQFSVSLSTQASEHRSFIDLKAWIADNLQRKLTINALADRVAMSPRHFSRVFARELGVTPARYLEQIRMEAAYRYLEQTRRSVKEIATACGFGSYESLRSAFLRTRGMTPQQYRDQFNERESAAVAGLA